jgi:hypothetical protein
MTNQPRWDSVQPARSRREQTPSADAVQVLGGTSRRKAAAVSITQKISRRKRSVFLGSRVVRPARFFCAPQRATGRFELRPQCRPEPRVPSRAHALGLGLPLVRLRRVLRSTLRRTAVDSRNEFAMLAFLAAAASSIPSSVNAAHRGARRDHRARSADRCKRRATSRTRRPRQWWSK